MSGARASGPPSAKDSRPGPSSGQPAVATARKPPPDARGSTAGGSSRLRKMRAQPGKIVKVGIAKPQPKPKVKAAAKQQSKPRGKAAAVPGPPPTSKAGHAPAGLTSRKPKGKKGKADTKKLAPPTLKRPAGAAGEVPKQKLRTFGVADIVATCKRPSAAPPGKIVKGSGVKSPVEPQTAIVETGHRMAQPPPQRSRRSRAPAKVKTRSATAAKRQQKAAEARRRVGPALDRAADSFDALLPMTDAELASMPPGSAVKYLHEFGECVAWAKAEEQFKGQRLGDPAVIDQFVAAYLNRLFMSGEETSVARLVLHGAIFKHSLPKTRTTLPRSRRVLAGFLKDTPEASKDPVPEEALAVMADNLLRRHATTKGGCLPAVLSVAAMALQLDLGGRPTETIELTKANVIEPQGKRFPCHGVRFHGLDLGDARPNKSQLYDDTVLSRVEGDRSFYSKILPTLKSAARPGEKLLAPLTHPMYIACLQQAEEVSGLTALRTTPHSLRHTFATMALQRRELSLTALMVKLRVKQLNTVRVYGKPGVMQRRLQAMGNAKRKAGETLLKDSDLNPFVRVVPLLRGLRSRRQ